MLLAEAFGDTWFASSRASRLTWRYCLRRTSPLEIALYPNSFRTLLARPLEESNGQNVVAHFAFFTSVLRRTGECHRCSDRSACHTYRARFRGGWGLN